MPIAAVPEYLGQDFSSASPGMRFGMYLKLWGVNERSRALSWDARDTVYRIRGRNRQERELKEDNKRAATDTACRLTRQDKSALDALLRRQQALVKTLSGGGILTLPAQSTAPFSTGLGNEHPLENGFAFLWPYGLPYLPGSGVKGVLRQAARELAGGEWGSSEWSNERCYRVEIGNKPVFLSLLDILFGLESRDGGQEQLRGVLSFWDVIPQIKGNQLAVEVMTPHQKHYYQDGQSPHDSGQPIPITFLTVPPKSGFTFHVQCDTGRLQKIATDLTENNRWQTLIEAAFRHAFDWLGFGAKTAVGYGAMQIDPAVEKARLEADEQKRRETEEQARRDAEAAEMARKKTKFDALPEHEKALSALRDVMAGFSAPLTKDRYSAFVGKVNAYIEQARAWGEQERHEAAAEAEALFDKFGWAAPGQPGKKKKKQEDKKRKLLDTLRSGK